MSNTTDNSSMQEGRIFPKVHAEERSNSTKIVDDKGNTIASLYSEYNSKENSVYLVESWNNYQSLKEENEKLRLEIKNTNDYRDQKEDNLKDINRELLKALETMDNEFATFSEVPHNYKKLTGWPGDENPRTIAHLNALKVIEKAKSLNV